jgi:transketolase
MSLYAENKKRVAMNIDALAHIAYNLRVDVLRATTAADSGHPTSCLSAADIAAVLFFHTLNYDITNPQSTNNDRFILSKGHAAPLLFAVYKELGVISDEDFMRMRTINSVLEGHPTPRFDYIDVATGSLGMGLANGVGMALHARRTHKGFKTFVLLGDGELAEGSVWEAAALAVYYKLGNLIAVVDVNYLGQHGPTMHERDIKTLEQKFTAFGWQVYVVDGHSLNDLVVTFDRIQQLGHEKPVIVLAKTVKGYGVVSIEGKNGYHGKAFSAEELPAILEQLKKRFYQATWDGDKQPCCHVVKKQCDANKRTLSAPSFIAKTPPYRVGEHVALRQAFGNAIVEAGAGMDTLICLDADVGNSTFVDLFARKFSDRFIECFIAEQAMVSIAAGVAALGDTVLLATFGAFLTRAFDQLRMAAIGRLPLHVVGTHAGTDVGQDGPSQMALEDIALFCSLPQSVVLCPCDAVSCHNLVTLALNYSTGISYVRVIRGLAPIIYENNAQFKVGGFNVLCSSPDDSAVIIAAGICVHEALEAYTQLKKQGISVAVVDLYSIKPIDSARLRDVVKNAHSRVVSVEDHYAHGGLGAAVCQALVGMPITYKQLAVFDVPHSAPGEQLRSLMAINAQAIVESVRHF